MAQISYSGERYPQSAELRLHGQLPSRHRPSGGGCFVRPEVTHTLIRNGVRYYYTEPAVVQCIDPENHDHSTPIAQPYEVPEGSDQ